MNSQMIFTLEEARKVLNKYDKLKKDGGILGRECPFTVHPYFFIISR